MLNSTEWEITIHVHEFDESWMRYALGRRSDLIKLNSRFQHVEFFGQINFELL